jgi:hypothetical protein
MSRYRLPDLNALPAGIQARIRQVQENFGTSL